jgi:hypothetical protein
MTPSTGLDLSADGPSSPVSSYLTLLSPKKDIPGASRESPLWLHHLTLRGLLLTLSQVVFPQTSE